MLTRFLPEHLPDVEEAVSRQFDHMLFLRCETHGQLDALLDQLGQVEGINQTHTSVVLSLKIDRRSAVGNAPS